MLSLISHPRFILPSIATLAVGCAAAPVAGTTHPATIEVGRLPEYTSFPGIVIPQGLPTEWLTPQYDSKKWRIGNNPDLPFKYASWMSPAGDNPRLKQELQYSDAVVNGKLTYFKDDGQAGVSYSADIDCTYKADSKADCSMTLYNIGGVESQAGPVEVTMEKVKIEGP